MQHGDGCWLHAPLVRAFRALHEPVAAAASACDAPVQARDTAMPTGSEIEAGDPVRREWLVGESASKQMHEQFRGVRTHSFELWRDTEEGPQLAAGELGYSMGGESRRCPIFTASFGATT